MHFRLEIFSLYIDVILIILFIISSGFTWQKRNQFFMKDNSRSNSLSNSKLEICYSLLLSLQYISSSLSSKIFLSNWQHLKRSLIVKHKNYKFRWHLFKLSSRRWWELSLMKIWMKQKTDSHILIIILIEVKIDPKK